MIREIIVAHRQWHHSVSVRNGNADCWKVGFARAISFPFATSVMTIQSLGEQAPFTTADGSTIRSILDLTNAPVTNQSLAEATLPPTRATQRHYHQLAEELYFILEGTGMMEINGEVRKVRPGDGVLIPPGAWHQITADADTTLRFLCCCSPPYSHDDTYFD